MKPISYIHMYIFEAGQDADYKIKHYPVLALVNVACQITSTRGISLETKY